MIKKYPILLVFLFAILSLSVHGQESGPWSRVDVSDVSGSRIQSKVRVEHFSGFALDQALIKRDLLDVPSRRFTSMRSGKLMKFPDKEGRLITFRVQEAPVMSRELAGKFPDKIFIRKQDQIACHGGKTPPFFEPAMDACARAKREQNA